MQIKPMKSYLLRNGGMGVVLARIPKPVVAETWVGCIAEDGGFDSASWFENGRYLQSKTSEFDIIDEFDSSKKVDQ